MAYSGYGGYGSPMPGMPAQGMPQQGMPGGPMGPGMGPPMGGHMGGPMGGHMGGHMGGPMGGHMGGPMPGVMGGTMPGSMGGPPMGGAPYGSYPGSFNTPAPAANDPMWGYFTAIAGQDGEVDAQELQTCLTQSGFSGSYSPFSLDTCRIMIAMLDKDFTGKMGFSEFKELFAALSNWKQNFMMFDQDRSGTVEPHEMTQAISAMGYRVSPAGMNAIMKRYNKGGRIYFDDYVACCVKLRALTENFRRRDTMQQGSVTFQYDDFILCTMAI